MSLAAMRWAWDQPGEGRPFAKLVLLALANHADDSDRASPGVALLAQETAMSERYVHQMLRWLEARKLVIPEGSAGGRGRSREYRLPVDESYKRKRNPARRSVNDDVVNPEQRAGNRSLNSAQTLHTRVKERARKNPRTVTRSSEPKGSSLPEEHRESSPLGAFIDAYRAAHAGHDPTTSQRGPFQAWAARAEKSGEPRDTMLVIAAFVGAAGFTSAGWFNKALSNLHAGRPVQAGFPVSNGKASTVEKAIEIARRFAEGGAGPNGATRVRGALGLPRGGVPGTSSIR